MMNWKEENNRLERVFEFESFTQAIAFMVQCSFIVERHNHHPQWENVYNKLRVCLQTHDAGNIVTEKDRNLAREMDRVYARFSG